MKVRTTPSAPLTTPASDTAVASKAATQTGPLLNEPPVTRPPNPYAPATTSAPRAAPAIRQEPAGSVPLFDRSDIQRWSRAAVARLWDLSPASVLSDPARSLAHELEAQKRELRALPDRYFKEESERVVAVSTACRTYAMKHQQLTSLPGLSDSERQFVQQRFGTPPPFIARLASIADNTKDVDIKDVSRTMRLALRPEPRPPEARFNETIAACHFWRSALTTLSPALRTRLLGQSAVMETLVGLRPACRLDIEDTGELAALVMALRRCAESLHLELDVAAHDGRLVLYATHWSPQVPKDLYLPARSAAELAAVLDFDVPWRDQLERPVVDDPYLSRARQAIAAIPGTAAMPYEPWEGRVEAVAVITFNRPESLRACLDSYAESLRDSGRSHVEIMVFDDSTGDAARQNQAVIDELRAAGSAIRYVGVDAKRRIRDALSSELVGVPPDALDDALGEHRFDGTFRGGTHCQRNWVGLWFAGKRVVVADDDTAPAYLRAPDSDAAAMRAVESASSGRARITETVKGSLGHMRTGRASQQELLANVGGHAILSEQPSRENMARFVNAVFAVDMQSPDAFWLRNVFSMINENKVVASYVSALESSRRRSAHHEVCPYDLIAAAERQPDGLRSANFDGHHDLEAARVIGDFLKADAGTVRRLEGELEERPASAPRTPSFAGSTFVTAASLIGVDYSYRTGRDQDFNLALTRGYTSRHDVTAGLGDDFRHLHRRGLRWSNQPRAMLQESQTKCVHEHIREVFKHVEASAPIDVPRLVSTAQTREAETTAALANSAKGWFEEGATVHHRVRREIAVMQRALTCVDAAPGGTIPDDAMPLFAEWYLDFFGEVHRESLDKRNAQLRAEGKDPDDPKLRYAYDGPTWGGLDDLIRLLKTIDGRVDDDLNRSVVDFLRQHNKSVAEEERIPPDAKDSAARARPLVLVKLSHEVRRFARQPDIASFVDGVREKLTRAIALKEELEQVYGLPEQGVQLDWNRSYDRVTPCPERDAFVASASRAAANEVTRYFEGLLAFYRVAVAMPKIA